MDTCGLHARLATLVAVSNIRFTFAEETPFRGFICYLNPVSALVSDDSICQDMIMLFMAKRLELEKLFQIIAITLDDASDNNTFISGFVTLCKSMTPPVKFTEDEKRVFNMTHILHLDPFTKLKIYKARLESSVGPIQHVNVKDKPQGKVQALG
ncbi:hypothetical protein BDK51DRAFT_41373 [Blyttiomyces helicus]|uniref:Uncharacterized protein n=1 Tax=Blyttiomyces helicus TaxID=388810 RepID=A0A4P9WNL0_9FUNG|nr:hypothetical protein BDK51DRAFT_41373 [Blyttiomyces helicus]|eukprot:RKO93865.1 hypothetical protein BDK51DRAFT_41373 [Blyttiomyces helicus]